MVQRIFTLCGGYSGAGGVIGNTINCRSYSPSFKRKKSKLNPPEKQLRFEHTHEPIIDMETWEIVQKVRSGKRRPNKMGEMDMLSDMVTCADCRKRHYFCRCGSWNEAQEHTEEFLRRAMDKHSSQLRKELSAQTRKLEKAQKSILSPTHAIFFVSL